MINPVVLAGVIKDLATLESAITSETKALKSEFDKIGVQATAVNDLRRVGAWLHGQLPMLRRRQAAAALLESQGPVLPPGVDMQSLPEDAGAAFVLAGELAGQRVLDNLDANSSDASEATAAAAAIQRITARKGKLTGDDLAFLHAFYNRLGRGVYRVPGQLGDDKAAKAALVDGLLILSNEKAGGGFKTLPLEIRQDLLDTGWRYWNSPGDKAAAQFKGQGFPDLARFLLNRDPKSTVAPGDEFAVGLARSTVHVRKLQQWLKREYGSTVTGNPPEQMARTPQLNTSEIQQLLGLIGASHKAAADIMSDPEAVRAMFNGAWDDKGAALAGILDWAAKAALDPTSPDFVLAKRATADLINAVTTNGSSSDQTSADRNMFKDMVAQVQSNPELARAFSKLIAANLADFGAPEPSKTVGPGDEGHLRISTDRRHRFAMLASMDQQARVILKLSATVYKTQASAHPTYTEAKALGFIDALITAAAHNAIYWTHREDADQANRAIAEAQADDAMVKAVAGYVFGSLISWVPLKPGASVATAGKPATPENPVKFDHVVDAGKWVLSWIINDGILSTPEQEKVIPTAIDTSRDATGADVAQNQAAYDIATARLRTDPTGKSVAGLDPRILEHRPGGKLQLKDLENLTDLQRADLQKWAQTEVGVEYLEAYANTFHTSYTSAEKIEDGPTGLTNYVEAPTR